MTDSREMEVLGIPVPREARFKVFGALAFFAIPLPFAVILFFYAIGRFIAWLMGFSKFDGQAELLNSVMMTFGLVAAGFALTFYVNGVYKTWVRHNPFRDKE